VTYPGLGGQQPPPQNAAPAGQLVPGIQAGTTGQVVASRVIIIGTGGELLVYTPTAGAGNLIASVSGAATSDTFGNQVLQGVASYQSTFANAIIGGAVLFYTGTEAGGWTFVSQVETDSSGDLLLDATGHVFANGTQIDGGSTGVPNPNATSTNGLSSPGITGTSGAASAGTAHTHSGGSYVVGSGQHSHDIQDHTHPL
jgi:hypothetical protein